MIRIGENPEGDPAINKFLSADGEGMRGVIVAMHITSKKAIILALNSAFDGSVEWGKLYLVEEKKTDEYPIIVRQVDSVPNVKTWKVTLLENVVYEC